MNGAGCNGRDMIRLLPSCRIFGRIGHHKKKVIQQKPHGAATPQGKTEITQYTRYRANMIITCHVGSLQYMNLCSERS